MKHIGVIWGLVLSCTHFTFAQTSSDDLFSHINLTKMQTDYLFNKGLFETQYHSTATDVVDAESFFEIYKSVYYSSFGTPVLSASFDVQEQIDIYHESTNHLPLCLLDFKVDLLSAEQFNRGNLNFSNGYLEEMTSGDQNFTQHNLTIVSPGLDTIYTTEPTFTTSSQFFFTNTDNIYSIRIDFNDGHGWTDIALTEEEHTVYYSSEGSKNLKVEITTNDNEKTEHKSRIYVASRPPARESALNYEKITLSTRKVRRDYSTDDSESGVFKTPQYYAQTQLNKFEGYRFNSCSPGVKRIVYLLEGFDPLDNKVSSPQDFEDLFSTSRQKLNELGYDVIYVNMANSGDFIENSAYGLEKFLGHVNSLYPNRVGRDIIIGASMGGLVTRMALKNMEDKGIDHGVDLYISLDSPHLGAHIPVGVQFLLHDLASDKNFKKLSFLGKKTEELACPAAKQMLLHYKGDNGHNWHYQFYSSLNALGFPTKTRNISIVQGDNGGQGLNNLTETSSVKELFKLSWENILVKFNIKISSAPENSRGEVSSIHLSQAIPIPSAGIAINLFNFLANTNVPTRIVHIDKKHYAQHQTVDRVAGSYLPTFNNELSFNAFSKDFNFTIGKVFHKGHTFIPAMSAAGIQDAFDEPLINHINNSPFDKVYSQNIINTQHIFAIKNEREFSTDTREVQEFNVIMPLIDQVLEEEIGTTSKKVFGPFSEEKNNLYGLYIKAPANDVGYKIRSGNSIEMIARKEIKLSSGFHSEPGSHFIASLDNSTVNCDYEETDPNGSNFKLVRKSAENIDDISIPKENSNVTIFPNPGSGILSISTTHDATINSVEIHDHSGKILSSFTGMNEIDISSFPSGLYVIKTTTDKEIVAVKYLKE